MQFQICSASNDPQFVLAAGRDRWDLDAGRARLALEGGISTIRMLLCTQLYCDSALGRPAPRFDARAIGECHAMLDARSQGRRRRVCVPVLFKGLKSINTQYQRFAAGVQGCIWMYRCYIRVWLCGNTQVVLALIKLLDKIGIIV